MKKGMQIIVCGTLCFSFLMVGIFLGRSSHSGSFLVDTTRNSSHEPTDPSVDNAFHNHKININTAGIDELTLLPNIGGKLAERIISYRETNGNFQTVEDLMNVDGVGQIRLSQIRKYITVGGPS